MSKSSKPNLQRIPDPEVSERPVRRTFSAEYKLTILRELDACKPGEIGAVLRREGLYSSHITVWRRQRASGELLGLSPKKQGRPPKSRNPLTSEVAELQRENAKLQEELRKARLIIEVQKKVSEILGSLPVEETGGKNE